MGYRVEQEKDLYRVIEKGTELNVYSGKSKRKIYGICRKLNLGHGFAGFTPAFFTHKFK